MAKGVTARHFEAPRLDRPKDEISFDSMLTLSSSLHPQTEPVREDPPTHQRSCRVLAFLGLPCSRVPKRSAPTSMC